jgi:AcrR family transcriptional regulator
MALPEAKGSSAARSRRQTEIKLKSAIERFQASGSKVSISAVAKDAQVTRALIHNTYPDIAERIRGLMGRNTRSQRDAKHDALVRERERNRELRAEIDSLRSEMAKLASLNLTLLSKINVLSEIAEGNVVPFAYPEQKSK